MRPFDPAKFRVSPPMVFSCMALRRTLWVVVDLVHERNEFEVDAVSKDYQRIIGKAVAVCSSIEYAGKIVLTEMTL